MHAGETIVLKGEGDESVSSSPPSDDPYRTNLAENHLSHFDRSLIHPHQVIYT